MIAISLLIGCIVALITNRVIPPRDWLEELFQGLFCIVFWPVVLAIFAFVKAIED